MLLFRTINTSLALWTKIKPEQEDPQFLIHDIPQRVHPVVQDKLAVGDQPITQRTF